MSFIFNTSSYPSLRRELFGLSFRHPVGLAPGFIPDGEHTGAFPAFSFVEVGPLTVIPQGGANPGGFMKRRMCAAGSVDNRGVGNAISHLGRVRRKRGLVMANLAPAFVHRSTEDVVKDLTSAFTMMYDFADMFVVDTFRPNCDGVVALQNIDILSEALDSILDMRNCYDEYKPVFVRVLPTISRAVLAEMLNYMRLYGIDGIVAGFNDYPLDLVADIVGMTGGRFPVIACGGADTPRKVDALLDAGASLVQVGMRPGRILKHLDEKARGVKAPTVGKDEID